MRLTKEYFKKQGSIGGKKHNATQSMQTKLEKYGPDYFKKIAAKSVAARKAKKT